MAGGNVKPLPLQWTNKMALTYYVHYKHMKFSILSIHIYDTIFQWYN